MIIVRVALSLLCTQNEATTLTLGTTVVLRDKQWHCAVLASSLSALSSLAAAEAFTVL